MIKKIGLKKISSGAAGIGRVKSIRQGSEYSSRPDDGMAEVVVEHGPKPKPPKNVSVKRANQIATPYVEPQISRLFVPAEVARTLRIGQSVRVTIERV